jgi:hypothetical protein
VANDERRPAAADQARAAFVEAKRSRHFLQRLQQWQLAPHAVAFLDALRAEIADRAAAGHDSAAAQEQLA